MNLKNLQQKIKKKTKKNGVQKRREEIIGINYISICDLKKFEQKRD